MGNNKLSFKIPPYKHQIKAIAASEMWDNMALWWGMGCGKTKASIEILRSKYTDYGHLVPTVILAPLITLPNWKAEFALHSNIDARDIIVLNKAAQRKKKITEAIGSKKILIINYEAVINETIFKLLKQFDAKIFILDEAHYLKTPGSKRSKGVFRLTENSWHRYLLSGTPMLNDAMDLFMPYKIMDRGKTFGVYFSAFKQRYFFDANAKWAGKQGYFPKWEPRPELFPELNQRIYNKALRETKAGCLDLPPLIKKEIEVPMSPEQKRLYKDMEKDFIAFIEDSKDAAIASIAVVKALKMRQIISGFLKTEKETIALKTNPRLHALEEILETSIKESKIIVWACFKQDHKVIAKMLKEKLKLEEGIGFVLLTGDQTATQKEENMNTFRKKEACRIVVATQSAAGIGINLVEADTMIYFSRTYSMGEDKQSESRNHRGGSEIHKKILRIDLVTPDTIDRVVMDALSKKEKTSTAIIDYMRGKKCS